MQIEILKTLLICLANTSEDWNHSNTRYLVKSQSREHDSFGVRALQKQRDYYLAKMASH